MYLNDNKEDGRKMQLRKLLRVVQELRKIDPKMELTQVSVLLTVALEQGITTADLAKRLKLTSSSASRNVLALSRSLYVRRGAAPVVDGHDLVTSVTNPMDNRSKQVALTRRGDMLVTLLSALLEGGDTASQPSSTE